MAETVGADFGGIEELIITDSHPSQPIAEADVVIFNQDGGSSDFGQYCHGPEHRRYLEVKRGTGANEIAEEIFNCLGDCGLHVITASVQPPAGMLSTYCLNPDGAVPLDMEDEHLRAGLLTTHRSLVERLKVMAHAARKALMLDIHTLDPLSPAGERRAKLEDAESLNSLVQGRNSGAQLCYPLRNRPVVLLDKADNRVIGSPAFTANLFREFQAADVDIHYNGWLSLGEDRNLTPHLIGKGNRGTALYVPKTLLTDTPQPKLDLSAMELNPEMVKYISRIVFRAISSTLAGK